MLILIILLAIVTRIPFILDYNFPFSFDHGRDALAVMHLIQTWQLKFIGPWTSIPGLFFGPGWYYLLTPGYLLMQGNPYAGPITMLIINLITIWLAYKYFGIYEAIIFSSAPIFTVISTSAANPFPMVLISLLILICLKEPKNKAWQLGILIGLGFHFSSALAIFYLLIIPLILRLKKNKIGWLKFIAGVGIPFIPQLLFELKNNFIESRAVINYFIQGESQRINLGKIQIVTNSIIHELGLAILPEQKWLKITAMGLLAAVIIFCWKKQKLHFVWPELTLFLIIPLLGFWFLHYNVWYVYGLMPVMVIAAGRLLKASPKILAYGYLSLLVIGTVKIPEQQNGVGFLKTKLAAINYIYEQTGNQPFSSYQYLPNIYDYAYQYLYFWQGFKGRQLPVEFSYKPEEINYVNEKPDLLSRLHPFDFAQGSGGQVKTFLIIEKPENVWHYPLRSWLDNIHYSEIISQKEFGPELEVWEVR